MIEVGVPSRDMMYRISNYQKTIKLTSKDYSDEERVYKVGEKEFSNMIRKVPIFKYVWPDLVDYLVDKGFREY